MTLSIEQMAVHHLHQRDDQTITLHLNEQLLDPDAETVIQLVERLHHHFMYRAKTFALFTQQSVQKERLQPLLTNSTAEQFLTFSVQLAEDVEQAIARYPLVEGGALIFSLYHFLGQRYLMTAIVSLRTSLRIDEHLSVNNTHYLDIEHADRIAVINLTEWRTEPDSNRYLSFLKGRVGHKVTDFFLDVLGAEEGIDMKVQNRLLNETVTAYCQEMALPDSETQAVKKQVYDYGKQQWQAGEEIDIAELSSVLPSHPEQTFQQFAHEKQNELVDHFTADKAVLRQLTKYSGSGGGVTISFDSQLLNERVIWDEANDTLTIHKLPPNLRDQLQKMKGKN